MSPGRGPTSGVGSRGRSDERGGYVDTDGTQPYRQAGERSAVLRFVGEAEADAAAILEHVGPQYAAVLVVALTEGLGAVIG